MLSTSGSAGDTGELLRLWHLGDRAALDQLLEQHLEALQRYVSVKLDKQFKSLRSEYDSLDVVHETVVLVLGYKPRFVPENGAMFQAMLRVFVLNYLKNRLRGPRHMHLEPTREFSRDSIVDLTLGHFVTLTPLDLAMSAEQHELQRSLIGIALEFLPDDDDRRLVFLAKIEEQPWKEVGEAFGISPAAARMRWEHRICPKLSSQLIRLVEGRIESLMDEYESGT